MTIPVLILLDVIILALLVFILTRIFREGRQRALKIAEDEEEERVLGEEE